jgi:hypothetical protein
MNSGKDNGWVQEAVLTVGDLSASITSKARRDGGRAYCYVCSRQTPGQKEDGTPEMFVSKYLRPRDLEQHRQLLDQVAVWFVDHADQTPVERPRRGAPRE